MKLHKKFKKVVALAMVTAVSATSLPVSAAYSDHKGHWAQEAIERWSTKGIVTGYQDGTFKPNANITRAELAQIITQVFGLSYTEGAKTFKDVEAKWYVDAVKKVTAAGIMNGYEDSTFRPNAKITREEAARVIAKAYKLVATYEDGQTTFVDKAQIASWAETEVAALVAGGVLSGYPDGSLQPKGLLTRAEVVSMLSRITSKLINEKGEYSQDVEGNVVVNAPDVVLKDMTITGDLYLAEGIKEGDITLNSVTVLGRIIVEGGGQNTVHITGKSIVNDIIINKLGGKPVRIAIGSLAQVKNKVEVQSSALIEGNGVKIPHLLINGAKAPVLKGNLSIAKVDVLTATELTMQDGVKINEMTIAKEANGTVFTGKGSIVTLKNNAEDVKVDSAIVITNPVVGTPVQQPTKPGGGGGGGGGSVTPPSTPNVALQEIVLGIKDSKTGQIVPKAIKITGALDIVVDNSGEKGTISIEGVDVSDAILSTVTFKSNAQNVTFNISGFAALSVELESGKAYTLQDLQKMVLDRQEEIKTRVSQLSKVVGLDKAQVEVVLGKLDKVFTKIEQQTATEVSVQDMLKGISVVEGLAEANTAYYEYINKIADLLTDFTISGLDKDIKEIKMTLAGIRAAASGHNTSQHTVNVTYYGK